VCHTLYSLAICFTPSLSDSFLFLTLTRLVVVINCVNFSFALFTPPLGDFQSTHLSRSQSTPPVRLASPETREAPQALRPSETPPKAPNHPRRSSPANMDRVSHCAIFQFLAYTASASLGKASRANQLNYPTVSRPKDSPPTNSPACARGPAYSGHLRRRPAPRRDRCNLPDLPGHLTGAISPPVSPTALFSTAGTVSNICR
jgi:hypothetical protein